MDPRLGAVLRAGGGAALDGGLVAKTSYGVSVLIRGDASRQALEAVGAVVGTQAGSITTADVPIEAIPALLSVPGIEQIEASTGLEPLLDVSAPEIEAFTQWQYVPPASFTGTTGRGVVVGIVDTGIDFTNPDFKKTTNQTRIKYIWDQTTLGTPPSGFTYGTEWTEAQINAGTPSERDTDGHGTHIAGIAAGDGSATGNGYPGYRYIGIAPEADIIVVKGTTLSYLSNFVESKVVDGVNYIFQKAASMGKDAVVLLAMGNHRGGHDGTSSFDQALSALTGPGKVIVAAAGNDGGVPRHSMINLGSGQTALINILIPAYTPTPTINEYLDMEGWHEPTASFKAKLTSPNGYTTNWINPGTSSGVIPTPDGAILLKNDMVTNSKGAKQIYVFLNDIGDDVPPRAGTWKLEVQRLTGTTTGILHSWITSWGFASIVTPPSFTTYVDLTRLVTSPATGDSIISVGAYATKIQWLNANQQLSGYPDNPTLLAIAPFSSPGPRRDGVQRPDLAAPGYGIMAGLSADELITNNWKAEDGAHRMRKGTSAAAAHAAGAVAILLQLTPDAKPSVIRSTLIQRATSDVYTGAVPNGTWGYGKLSLAPRASTSAGGTFSVPTPESYPAFPNPTAGAIHFEFALSTPDLEARSDQVHIRIIDVQGREVALVKGQRIVGRQTLTWDGTSPGGRTAPPGVYFARLEGVQEPITWKFVRMR